MSNTAQWVKLTIEGNLCPVNLQNAREITHSSGGACIHYSETHWRFVDETPDQILALIKGESIHTEKTMD